MCLGYKKHYKPYQTKPYQTLVAHALPLWTSTVPRIICIIKALSPGLYGLEWLFTLFYQQSTPKCVGYKRFLDPVE